MTAFIDPLETVHQERVGMWLDMKKVDWFPVINGARVSSMAQARKLKREGMKAGIPDILIITPSPTTKHPVALEMKRIVAEKHKLPCNCLEDDQILWRDKFVKNGWTHILAHGSDDAIETLERLGY
jgi:hypothetical protein